MKLEAIKRLPGRPAKENCDPVGHNSESLRSVESLAADSDDSKTQIQRYIRLTSLIKELQDFVDEGKIKMRPAVELSYLDEESQRDVVDLIDDTESFPSHDQAIRMRKAFEAGKLDYNVVDDVMREEKPNQKPSFRIKYEDVKAFFKPTDTPEKVLKDILQGLQLLKRQRDKGAR